MSLIAIMVYSVISNTPQPTILKG